MLINLTAISTGFWKEGVGEERRKDRLGLRSGEGYHFSMDLVTLQVNRGFQIKMSYSWLESERSEEIFPTRKYPV